MLLLKNIVVPVAVAIVAVFCLAAARPASDDYTVKWLILQQCMVKVNGSTNISKFACTVVGYSNNDTLTCLIRKGNRDMIAIHGDMKLPVAGFDCVNTMMTRDLRKTLKGKEFPDFFIHFISMERYPLLTLQQEPVTALVNIELAGVKKQLEIHFRVSMDARGVIQLAGTQHIYFSDFNLTPPRKLGGMIKTDDKLEVEFIIYCRIIK